MKRHVRFYASLGGANDNRSEVVDMVDVGYDGWDEMTAKEQENACEDYYNYSFLPNVLDSGWHEDES